MFADLQVVRDVAGFELAGTSRAKIDFDHARHVSASSANRSGPSPEAASRAVAVRNY